MAWRNMPGDNSWRYVELMMRYFAESIEPAVKAAHPDTDFRFEVPAEMPGMAPDPHHELTVVTQRLTRSNSAGKMSYGTEDAFCQEADISTIIRDPGHIAQSHGPDEFVSPPGSAACDRSIRQLPDRLLT
jgi:acetylornithine deacetylase